jgi:hypothetical protein
MPFPILALATAFVRVVIVAVGIVAVPVNVGEARGANVTAASVTKSDPDKLKLEPDRAITTWSPFCAGAPDEKALIFVLAIRVVPSESEMSYLLAG